MKCDFGSRPGCAAYFSIIRLLLFLALLSALVNCGGGGVPPNITTDYYVSSAGSDSNGTGTAANPWATIQYASLKIGPGATVHVAPGTYVGDIVTNTSGTSNAPITYVSDVPLAAKLIGPPVTGTMNLNLVVWDNEGNYVTIKGFDVSGAAYQGIGTEASFEVIEGNHIHDVIPQTCNGNGGAGVTAGGDTSFNVDVIGNVIHDVANLAVASVCGYEHGIYHHGRGGHVWNNIIYHNWGFGIQLWGTPPAQDVTISGNTVLNNGYSGFVVGTDGPGVADYVIVTDNIFVYNNGNGFEEQGMTGPHNQYNNNLSFGNVAGFYSLQTGSVSATIEADPLMVNYQPDGGDDHLTASSPAINAGTSQGAPSSDFSGDVRPQARSTGNGWDIGAYEFVATPAAPTILWAHPRYLISTLYRPR